MEYIIVTDGTTNLGIIAAANHEEIAPLLEDLVEDCFDCVNAKAGEINPRFFRYEQVSIQVKAEYDIDTPEEVEYDLEIQSVGVYMDNTKHREPEGWEYEDVGDCTETEKWRDAEGKVHIVPLEITRDFSEAYQQ